MRQSAFEKIYVTKAEASFSTSAKWPRATSINVTAAASPFRLLSLDRLPREMTPNHMKYPSFCCKLPLGIFKAGNVGSFISGLPQGSTRLYYVRMKKDMSTNLVLFRLPSSDRVLVEHLFFESQDLTPSTRSSTSESVSVSSPL